MRDNRLNMIHEGTPGIHGLDLLGGKVLMENGRAMELLRARISDTAQRARAVPQMVEHANALMNAWQAITDATVAAWASGKPDEALANAVPHMQAFGHGVLAWIWLDVALASVADNSAAQDEPARAGTIGALQYFYRYELPKTGAWLDPVRHRDMTCADLPEEAF